jgi:hypothetical protein
MCPAVSGEKFAEMYRKDHTAIPDRMSCEFPLAASCVLNCLRAAGEGIILMERLE